MVTLKNNQVVADVGNLDIFADSILLSLSTINYQIVQSEHDNLFCKDDFYNERIKKLLIMYNFLFEIYCVYLTAKEDF